MRAYTTTAAILFLLIGLAHLLRLAVEGTHLLQDPGWDLLTLLAFGMAAWGLSLLRRGRE